jgi:dienelactone hydrolase
MSTTVASGLSALAWAPLEGDALPVVVLVHGSHCTPSMYDGYATGLARAGFVVIAPEQIRTVFGDTAHYPQQAYVNWGLDWAIGENEREGSPLRGRIDTEHLFITGHSMGGGVSLGVASDVAQMGLSDDEWSRPRQLVAAAVNGTHNIPPPRTGDPLPVDNKVPIAFVQGTADGLVTAEQVERTFAVVHGVKPWLRVLIDGGNHYFITDADAPDGARPDPVPMALDQAASVAAAASWTATWFRSVMGDADAAERLRAAEAHGSAPDAPFVVIEYVQA